MLMQVRMAKLAGKDEFDFLSVKIPLKENCGVFVTMNPGYAGRTELPDNLAILFRPVSMMVASYLLIAEVMLCAEGFEQATKLSHKVVVIYRLLASQLSSQDHYDFGMRAIKTLLVAAGELKRSNPSLSEEVLLVHALRDTNVPKLLAEDIPLFDSLVSDLLPGVEAEERDQGELGAKIVESIPELGFGHSDDLVGKVIQLFATLQARFGVMLVGPSGAGKTTCYQILAHAQSSLRA